MDPTDKQWDSHPDMKTWVEWMGKLMPAPACRMPPTYSPIGSRS